MPGETCVRERSFAHKPKLAATAWLILLSSLVPEARAASCDGNACRELRISEHAGCVWIENSSAQAIDFVVTLKGETMALTLEGADRAKAAAAERSKPSAEEMQKRAKQQATRKVRDELRAQGIDVPYDPEFEGPRETPSVEQDQSGTAKDKAGAHRMKYSPDGAEVGPVYELRLVKGTGCIGRKDWISYTAIYKGTVSKRERRPCAGNACEALVEVPPCSVKNGGTKTMTVNVDAIGDMTLRLGPGESTELTLFMGCVHLDEVKKFEANSE